VIRLIPALLLIALPAAALDLSQASIQVEAPEAERAASIFVEEVAARTGITLPITGDGTIAFYPPAGYWEGGEEEYRIIAGEDRLLVQADSPRGYIYAVGHLLRTMTLREGEIRIPETPFVWHETPEYPLRGHQLGYRAAANAYDAWSPEVYEQYIRELALFGINAIEMIPFQDDRPAPLMPVPRRELDLAVSRICAEHDLQFWIWTPAPFDLSDSDARAESIAEHADFYAAAERLDAVFFPGGDPGDNHPDLVMPFLEDIAELLAEHHPEAKIWLSLQGFNEERVDFVYDWLDAEQPDWFGGVVCGPGSPLIPESRARLDARYGLRHYPDITHTIRSQYPTPWWDSAFNSTLGREPVNPEPVRYAYVHNIFAPYTIGFITYSDGINDDVNKTIWSALGWDSTQSVRDILVEYSRLYLGHDIAEAAADGILALERNWRGPIVENGAIDGTLAHWQRLEDEYPELHDNWRFQTFLLRAYYDAFVRHRAIYDRKLELRANDALRAAADGDPQAAAEAALAILAEADELSTRPEWRQRIIDLCADLFESIGFQTSVEEYGASGHERGAVLDYIDYPLNNRWWIEAEIEKALALEDEAETIAALLTIANWEDAGPGGFYDDIGNVANSPRVVRTEPYNTNPIPERGDNPDFMWWDSGFHDYRQSWVSKMDWPDALRYTGLDPDANYIVRITGYAQCFLFANGERVHGDKERIEMGEINSFAIPQELTRDRELVLTFEKPHEPGINWRQQSRLSEVWLVKDKTP